MEETKTEEIKLEEVKWQKLSEFKPGDIVVQEWYQGSGNLLKIIGPCRIPEYRDYYVDARRFASCKINSDHNIIDLAVRRIGSSISQFTKDDVARHISLYKFAETSESIYEYGTNIIFKDSSEELTNADIDIYIQDNIKYFLENENLTVFSTKVLSNINRKINTMIKRSGAIHTKAQLVFDAENKHCSIQFIKKLPVPKPVIIKQPNRFEILKI